MEHNPRAARNSDYIYHLENHSAVTNNPLPTGERIAASGSSSPERPSRSLRRCRGKMQAMASQFSGNVSPRENTTYAESTQSKPRSSTSKRNKIALACEECRARKVRCDGARPHCSSCRRRNRGIVKCTYSVDMPKSTGDRQILHALYQHVQHLENLIVSMDTTARTAPESSTQAQAANTTSNKGPLLVESTGLKSVSWIENYEPFRQHGKIQSPLPSSPDHQINLDTLRGVSECKTSKDESMSINAMGVAALTPEDTTSKDEEFYGVPSTASFFQQIHETAKKLSGQPFDVPTLRKAPSIVNVQRQSSNTLGALFSDPQSVQSFAKFCDCTTPPRALADRLVDAYRYRVHCLYPFVHWPTFSRAYTQLWKSRTEPPSRPTAEGGGLGSSDCPVSVFYCGLSAAFALGAQFLPDLSEENRSMLHELFRRSFVLQTNSLDHGSLALVQTLLLMAQYLQSTDLPNRCWNVVGIACRIGQGLGLHLEQGDAQRSQINTEMRRRTWHGCVSLDTVLSMTLGRPSAQYRQSLVNLPSAVDDEYIGKGSGQCIQPPSIFSYTHFFVETVKLYSILGEILSSIYDPCNKYPLSLDRDGDATAFGRDGGLVFHIEVKLRHFESELPEQLQWSVTSPTRPSNGNSTIARQRNVLHARFLNVRILLYRPMLLRFCRQQSRPTAEGQTRSSPDSDLLLSFTQQCALHCVRVAQELVTLLHSTLNTTDTGAWWYNLYYLYHAAMVLTLGGVCPALLSMTDSDLLGQSWRQCLGILRRMADCSASASKCYQELSNMLQSIAAPQISLPIAADDELPVPFPNFFDWQSPNAANSRLDTVFSAFPVGLAPDSNYLMNEVNFNSDYDPDALEGWAAGLMLNN